MIKRANVSVSHDLLMSVMKQAPSAVLHASMCTTCINIVYL